MYDTCRVHMPSVPTTLSKLEGVKFHPKKKKIEGVKGTVRFHAESKVFHEDKTPLTRVPYFTSYQNKQRVYVSCRRTSL